MSKNHSSWITATICISVGIVLSLLIGQLIWSQSSQKRVDTYAKSLLQHAELVAGDGTAALNEIDAITAPPCSPGDLSELRRLEFAHGYIKDAGRMDGDKVICSAASGKLEEPHTLTSVRAYTRNATVLWVNTPSFSLQGQNVDLAQRHGAFVVTSPTSFAAFDHVPRELRAVVTTGDGQLLMRSFGHAAENKNNEIRQEAFMCSEKFDICVNAHIDQNIFSCDRLGLLASIAVCGILGGLLAFVFVNRMVNRSLTLAARLSAAIKSDQITLLYQPIICASTGQLVGMEALARWHDDRFGEIRPDIFIGEVSRIGMKTEFNANVIQRALREAAPILHENPSVYVSINIEVDALLAANFITFIKDETDRHQLHPQQIALEIVEGATTDIKLMKAGIEGLRDAGYQIFIDDFGTGYSGLSYLGKLEVDKIKIDKMFTQAAGGESAAATIFSMVVEMARGLNVGVIFEGVETEEQVNAVQSVYPHALIQGWIYSKAVSIKEVKLSYCR